MAHDLKPFVMIGQHGLSESVLAEMESTMLKHELIKIKLRISDREEKLKIINKIRYTKEWLFTGKELNEQDREPAIKEIEYEKI